MKYITSTLIASTLPLMAQNIKPANVIVFLVDDMGLMDTSVPFITDAQGKIQRQPLNDWYRTPSMARLAQQGTCISKCYAQSVSSPTRASIMTGQNSTRHGTTNWINGASNNRGTYGPLDWNWEGVKKNVQTLPKVLQSAGYRTIQIGKAHFGCNDSEGENPLNLGFDVKVGGCAIGHPGSYSGMMGYGKLKENKSHAVPDLDAYHGTETHLSDALTLEANKAITQAVKDDQPFFMYFGHYAVHAPFETDERFIANYPQSKSKSKMAGAFATLIEGMDKSLGDVMDHLESLNIAENTLIIFVGDNGSDSPLGKAEDHASAAPLRGKKGSCYEGGVRVPFIAAWAKPDASNAHQQKFPIKQDYMFAAQRATVMDIYPTVLDVAEVKAPAKHVLDGQSLTAVFKGEQAPLAPRGIVMHFPHGHNSNYFTTYIQDDWKLIYYYNPETPDKPTYNLYNLAVDPYENEDLAATEPKKLAEMCTSMIAQMKSENALPPVTKAKKPILPQVPN